MLNRKFLAMLSMLLLAGCGAHPFVPVAYEIRAGAIDPFDVAGDVQFMNDQPAADVVEVHSYGGTSFQSNYHAITDAMMEQAREEMKKNGRGQPGRVKTMRLKVTQLESNYVAFYWHSKMHFQVALGNGTVIEKDVTHGTGGGVLQDLNGCIAQGVIELYKDAKVTAYLAN